MTLAAGDYCIVPSTYHPGEEAEFLLRIWTDTRWKCTVDQGKEETIRDFQVIPFFINSKEMSTLHISYYFSVVLFVATMETVVAAVVTTCVEDAVHAAVENVEQGRENQTNAVIVAAIRRMTKIFTSWQTNHKTIEQQFE